MKCPFCRAEAPIEAAFCPACGHSFAAVTGPTPELSARKATKRVSLWVRLLAGVFGAVVVVVILGLVNGNSATVSVGAKAHGFIVSGTPQVGVNYAVLKASSAFNTSSLTVELLRGSNSSGWSTLSTRSQSILPSYNEVRIPFYVLLKGGYQVVFLKGSTVLGSHSFTVS